MASINEELAGIRHGLEASGYELRVDGVQADLLRLSVVARAAACRECLMPKDIMLMVVQQALLSRPEIRRIEVRYPHD